MGSRNIVISMPKNKIDKDKTREEKQEKLKQLQQQFLYKNKEVTKDNIKNEIAIDKIENLNSAKKNIDKDTKKRLNIVNKKLEELREKEKKNKDIIFKLKNNISVLNEELKKEKDNNIILINKLNKHFTKNNELETKIKTIEEEYEKFKQSYTIKAFNIVTRDIYNRDEKIIRLQNHITRLKESIENYKKQIFDLNHGEEITIRDKKYYHKIITSYAQANAKLNKKLLKLEQEYKEKLSKLVNSNLVLSQLKHDVNEVRIKKFVNRTQIKSVLGYLKIINCFVFFESVDKNKYIANIDRIDFEENAPCRATIRNNIATITRVYNNEDIFIKELKENRESKRMKQEKKDFVYEDVNYENHYNVLIIGAENKDKYSSTLRKIGLNVLYYNSYEGNVVRLRNMLNRYDIVICCLRHSRHYASNLMTYMQEHDVENALKYNIIDKDNLENIIGRVRYCIENMK